MAQRGPRERKARNTFRQGQAYFEQKLYDKAIEQFQKAYDLVPRPLILFHVARSYQAKGDKQQALAYYRRFLADEPDGDVPEEARRYVAVIEKEMAEERAAAAARERELERKRKEEEKKKQDEARRETAALAESMVALARQYEEQEIFAKAAGEHRKAFELDSNPEHLFDQAEALRRDGDKAAARDVYIRYVATVPTGERADAARGHIGTLTHEIDEEENPERYGKVPLVPDGRSDVETPAKKPDDGTNWLWVGIGAAALAGGVIMDLAPSTAENGEVDVLDFLPVALYGASAGFLWVGVF